MLPYRAAAMMALTMKTILGDAEIAGVDYILALVAVHE